MKKNMTPCAVRYHHDTFVDHPILVNAGWHFSYFGDADAAIKKLESTAHQEYNNDVFKQKDKIIESIANYTDLLGRNIQYDRVPLEASLPQFVLENTAILRNKGMIRE
jgi:beta-1,4-mannosyl-glycoprotein beta-1,4-N-acetylglucosaminyltransferase